MAYRTKNNISEARLLWFMAHRKRNVLHLKGGCFGMSLNPVTGNPRDRGREKIVSGHFH